MNGVLRQRTANLPPELAQPLGKAMIPPENVFSFMPSKASATALPIWPLPASLAGAWREDSFSASNPPCARSSPTACPGSSSNETQRPQRRPFQCTLLSLPHLLENDARHRFRRRSPISTRLPQAISRLGAVIGEGDGLKVGLAWAGNPKHLLDKERPRFRASRPPSCRQGRGFLSLQLGAAAREASASITDLAPELTDFAQTAGAIANLDLVISVDTAVAHLGGAMGKPVWIMLPFVPDWRWLLERKDSPWYPTARLFRQKTRGDWGPVVGEIARALARREPDRQGSTPAGMTAGMPAKRPGLAIREPSAHSTPPRQSPTGLETLAMADEPRAFYLRARIAKDAGEQPAAIEFINERSPPTATTSHCFVIWPRCSSLPASWTRRSRRADERSPWSLTPAGSQCARHHVMRAWRKRRGNLASAARHSARARLRCGSYEPRPRLARLRAPRRRARGHERGHSPEPEFCQRLL